MVQQARSQGWFFSANNVVRGYGSIATLLPLPQDQGMLAIGFGASTNHLSENADWLKDVLRRNVIQFENQSLGNPDLSLAIAGE